MGPEDGYATYVGQFGHRVIEVGPVDVEVWTTDQHEGDIRVTSVAFPIPGVRGAIRDRWAVVQIGQLDGSRWTVGIGGWLHVDYPTMLAAVEAVCDPTARAQMLAFSRHWDQIFAAEARGRALRGSQPPRPAGACPSQWEGLLP
ncbi:MAG TPA: hypothetical protein VJT31_28610 [Rugosimonospora sp.]|nr:hypothetical protein [Rugosimonospora sp.]